MWWKLYFWIYTIFTVMGLLMFLAYLPWGVYEGLSVFLSIVSIFALYSYSYKKKLLSSTQWLVLWWIMLALFIESMIERLFLPKGFVENLLPFMKSNLPIDAGTEVLSWVLSIPVLYSLFKLSKKEVKKPLVKKSKTK